jgi:hypothetical protein
MYIAVVPNRSSPPAILLRESYRDGSKVKTRTLANLSDWSPIKIEALRAVLGDRLPASGPDGLEIIRSRPHGHVAAVLGTLRRVGLDRVIDPKRSPERDRCVAMIAARVLDPRSKLALARALSPETLQSTLGEELGAESVTEDELYASMDWLVGRQDRWPLRSSKATPAIPKQWRLRSRSYAYASVSKGSCWWATAACSRAQGSRRT